ncbi:hypothetical protein BH09BAC5_BH09BAC5_17770 [soil metagenome]
MKRALVLCLLLFANWKFLNAQPDIGCKFGYSYQRSTYLEAGLLVYHRNTHLSSRFDMYGMDIGSDFRIGGSKFIMGPKISFEMHVLVFSGRITQLVLPISNKTPLQFLLNLELAFWVNGI